MFIITERELYHYGVKGMKWGVRKDQNSGSKLRTAAKILSPVSYALVTTGVKVGKAGVKAGKAGVKAGVKAGKSGVKKYKKKKSEIVEKQRTKALDSSTSGKYTYRQRKKLSNSELQSRIDRLSMEKKLKDLAREDSRDFTLVRTGTKEARKALGIYGAKVLLDMYIPGSSKFIKNPNK